MANPYLSIIIPVCNEEKRLLEGLSEVKNYFDQQSYPYEVIIISNGSRDRTENLAQDFINGLDNFKLLSLPDPGKGLAFKTGFLASSGVYVLLTDIDMPVSLDKLASFFELMTDFDLVIASKFMPGSKALTPVPLFRQFTSFAFNLLTRIWLGLPFFDTQCGFKLIKRQVLLPIVQSLAVPGLCFDVELLYKARKQGLKVLEVPVNWKNSQGSNIKLIPSFIPLLRDLVQIQKMISS